MKTIYVLCAKNGDEMYTVATIKQANAYIRLYGKTKGYKYKTKNYYRPKRKQVKRIDTLNRRQDKLPRYGNRTRGAEGSL